MTYLKTAASAKASLFPAEARYFEASYRLEKPVNNLIT